MREVIAVLVGGFVGTGLRLGLDTLIPHGDDGFPVSTLLINITGSLALGMLVAAVWPRVNSWQKAGLGAGLVGSYTTFSALAVSLVSLTAAGEIVVAVVYLVASLALGFGAAWLGLVIGARLAPRVVDAAPVTPADEVHG